MNTYKVTSASKNGRVKTSICKSEKSLFDLLKEVDPTLNKVFNERHNVGKAKYVINYHDGLKKHPDGSPFFDIAIFKNKKKLKEFKDDLISKGYVEK